MVSARPSVDIDEIFILTRLSESHPGSSQHFETFQFVTPVFHPLFIEMGADKIGVLPGE
jgi:hypothetical protein